MTWRIRSSAHGGVILDLGVQHGGGEHIPGIIGATMPAFIVYESSHFNSERQAIAYANRRNREDRQTRHIISQTREATRNSRPTKADRERSLINESRRKERTTKNA